MSAEQSVEKLKDMRSEVSTMTMIDVHALSLVKMLSNAIAIEIIDKKSMAQDTCR
jgi:hypothetical protein